MTGFDRPVVRVRFVRPHEPAGSVRGLRLDGPAAGTTPKQLAHWCSSESRSAVAYARRLGLEGVSAAIGSMPRGRRFDFWDASAPAGAVLHTRRIGFQGRRFQAALRRSHAVPCGRLLHAQVRHAPGRSARAEGRS